MTTKNKFLFTLAFALLPLSSVYVSALAHQVYLQVRIEDPKDPLLTDIEALFAYSAATELTLGFDSSNIEHMHRLFEQCTNLKTVNFGDHWDCGNARLHVNNLFQGCTNLTTITGTISNLGKEFMNNVMVDLSPCPLTRESALVIINGLYDVATNGGPTGLSVKFRYETFQNLNSTDLAIITSKGWTYSSAPQQNA